MTDCTRRSFVKGGALALVGLSVLGMVPWWATLVMMGREIAITLLRFAVLRHGIIPASRGVPGPTQ